jgi:vacuolar protein sorting-associated protein 54
LSIRTEQHSALDLPGFLEVFNETWDFVIKSETLCRKMFISLRGAIVSQAKAFLQTMHQQRISQSAKLVEEEQWSASDVPFSSQAVANTIIDSAVRDSSELVVSSTAMTDTNGSATSSKHLRIEERTYYAVSATQKTIGLLVDYLKVIVNLSLLTTDTVSKVIEFLKAFNSRTCQVVLGAGAMRSAGLKNITAKHLGKILALVQHEYASMIMQNHSFSIAISVCDHRSGTIRSGMLQTAFECETGRHAHRI